MSREQERIRKNLEKNPVVECNKIQKKYYPKLFERFAGVKDPRNQSYIEYSTKTMLGTLYYKCIGGISSMREMTRKFNEENEFTKYHRSVLEAKLYLGNNLVCSVASETIQNSEANVHQSEEKVKQDCESKAFIRLAEKIKQRFPRLPIVIIADGLYVSQKVLETCKKYGWDYIIRYKEGSAPSIAEEYQMLPEKEKVDEGIEYQNQIPFKEQDVNLIYYAEKKKDKITEFAWITSIEITKRNAKKIA